MDVIIVIVTSIVDGKIIDPTTYHDVHKTSKRRLDVWCLYKKRLYKINKKK
jgi:hypothetical protein